MKAGTFIILTAGCLLAADAPQKAEVGRDKEKLQGAWTAVLSGRNGEEGADDHVKKIKLVIKGDRYSLHLVTTGSEGTFTLDPAKKPKAMDLSLEGTKETNPCIYELNGDVLKLCGSNDGTRPPEFNTKKDDGRWLLVFQRAQP